MADVQPHTEPAERGDEYDYVIEKRGSTFGAIVMALTALATPVMVYLAIKAVRP